MKFLWMSIVAFLLAASPAMAAEDDTTDGLVKARSKGFDTVELLPGVDFRIYTKVSIDPVEVAFRRNWQRDMSPTNRISNAQAAAIAQQARLGVESVFADTFNKAGYEVVSDPGEDVLRLTIGLSDLYIAAPDTKSAGIKQNYSLEAGEATLIVLAKDSLTGALLGRVVDRRTAGDNNRLEWRTSVSNRADFERLFRTWAKASVNGLERLKESPQVNPEQ